MHLLDVLVVVVHISHRNCWEYLLLHQDWGECSEGWVGAWGWKFLLTEIFFPTKFFFSKMFLGFWNACNFFFQRGGDFGVFGAPHAPTRGSRGVGKRYTSSYDHDMWPVKILERSGLAVKSYHPETLAADEEKKKDKKKRYKNSDKTIRKPGMPN